MLDFVYHFFLCVRLWFVITADIDRVATTGRIIVVIRCIVTIVANLVVADPARLGSAAFGAIIRAGSAGAAVVALAVARWFGPSGTGDDVLRVAGDIPVARLAISSRHASRGAVVITSGVVVNTSGAGVTTSGAMVITSGAMVITSGAVVITSGAGVICSGAGVPAYRQGTLRASDICTGCVLPCLFVV